MRKKGFFRASETASSKIKNNQNSAHCKKCGLYLKCQSPYMKPGGRGELKILHVAQAPGKTEDRKNEQLVGTVGKYYERILKKLGMELNAGKKTNVNTCFINPRTHVYTSNGYKSIINVQIGDLVLTHKGKFKKVLSRTHDYNIYTNKYARIVFKTNFGIFKTLCVTTDHRFLKNKKWEFVTNLKKGDKVKVLGEKCAYCGKIYPINPSKYDDTNHIKICSFSCKNKIIKVDSKKKSKQMKSLYKKGVINKNTITKNANEKVRRLSKEGKWKWFGEKSNPKKQTEGRQSKINRLGKNKRTIGIGEKEFSKYLQSQEINFISQYAIDRYNYDFYLIDENILIEIDNPQRDCQKQVQDRKKIKDRIANDNEIELIRLSSSDPVGEFKRLNKNHKNQYHFCNVEVDSVEIIESTRNYKLYSLEIEDDNSYVAMGLVNHNCYPPNDKKPTKTQIKACKPNLMKTIQEFEPHVIIALGDNALEALIGHKFSESPGTINKFRGYVIPDREYKAWICPTFHPSYVKRDTTPEVAEKLFKDDLEHAVKMLNVPLPSYIYENEEDKIEILKHPKETKLWLKKMLLLPEQKFMTAFDYETSGLKPQCSQQSIRTCAVSLNPDHSVAFPMFDDEEFKRVFSRYLAAHDIMKVAANMKFENDWSNVKLNMQVNGWLFDTMIGGHCIDNRAGVTKLEFQNYVNFGIEPYDEHIKKFIKKDKNARGNGLNDIYEADLKELLIYNGMDSMTEFRLAISQMERLGITSYHRYYNNKVYPSAEKLTPQYFVRGK